ncbi:rhodanese-like domain-containing protein, partial [Flavobacteriaceae bacterium]|nr:rhodanese-like domain-containing protein [Flavobacteriaceae bacterium]
IGDVEQAIVLVIPEGLEEETITRLSRVGFDHTLGYLKGGFKTWIAEGNEYDTVNQITAANLKTELESDIPVFDVRKENEFLSERLPMAKNSPLDSINSHLNDFPQDKLFYIHCAGGYRSMIAASILKSRGIHNFVDVIGGFGAIKEAELPLTEFVCPSTL